MLSHSLLQLFGRNIRYLSYGILHTFFSGVGQTFLVALFVPALLQEFGLSHSQFGTVYLIATFGSALLLPWAGRFIDRVNLAAYSTAIAVGLSVACFVLAKASGLVILVAGFLLLRLTGQGLLPHVSATAIARFFQGARGRALGIATLGAPLAEFVLPLYVVMLIEGLGWRTAFMAIGVTTLCLFIPAIWLLARKGDAFFSPALLEQQAKPVAQAKDFTRFDVVKAPLFYWLLPLAVAPPFLLTGFFFHQGALGEQRGWSMVWMASCFTLFATTRIVFSILSGFAIDRWTARRLFPYYIWPLALGLSFWLWGESKAYAAIYMLFAGVTVGMGNNIKSALWAELFGTKHLGAVRSMFSTIMIVSTAVSPALFGLVIDFGLPVDYLVYFALGFIALGSAGAYFGLAKEA